MKKLLFILLSVAFLTPIFAQSNNHMDITAITPTTDFAVVRDCNYKGEHYSVRDNGAIFRHARDGKPKRKNDEFWTFGRKDLKNGYMYLGSHRVHIIVANAFHGVMDSKVYVVDHIDTIVTIVQKIYVGLPD